MLDYVHVLVYLSNGKVLSIVVICRTFLLNRERAVDYLNMLDRLYVFDGYAGWDPEVSDVNAMCLHSSRVHVCCCVQSLFIICACAHEECDS